MGFGRLDEDRPIDQKSLTLVPLLQSIVQYLLYFGSAITMLHVWGFPTEPILAGADPDFTIEQQMARIFVKVARSYTRRRTRLDYLPPVFWLEPTNHCNLHCAMCPNSVIERGDGGFLPFTDCVRVVDEISQHYPHGGATVALFLSGEPLLHPELDQIIARIRKNGGVAGMITNGYLLTAERIERLNQRLRERGARGTERRGESYDSTDLLFHSSLRD